MGERNGTDAGLAIGLTPSAPQPVGRIEACRILFGDDHFSGNPKLNNCVKGWNAARCDWVILADSNVLMPRDYVQQMMHAWRPDTGLVCSTPIGSRPDGFWADAAKAVTWDRAPVKVLDAGRPPFYRWFPDARLNTCHNAVDRHVEAGKGDRTALIYDSPVTGTVTRYSYAELQRETAAFAGVLRSLGVEKGDRVVIYLPMVPQAAIAMLACARLGAIHSVVFGGFAPKELAVRIDDARPKVVVSASCGIEGSRVIAYKPLLDEALELAGHAPDACVILQRPEAAAEMTDRDVDWEAAMAAAEPADCVPVAATDPLYILYTSGTTGRPKGVVRDNGGHAVALAWSMANVYDIGPGDVWWAASDVGWVVGHSYIVYAPLLVGATTVLYEGKPIGTPDAGAFWRVISEHNVKALFTAPTALRAIRKVDPEAELLAGYDMSGFRTLFMAGERLDPGTYTWATETLGVPVIDNWWQTETGWPIAANLRGLAPMPIKPGSPTVPVPGYDLRILDVDGQPPPRALLAARVALAIDRCEALVALDDRPRRHAAAGEGAGEIAELDHDSPRRARNVARARSHGTSSEWNRGR